MSLAFDAGAVAAERDAIAVWWQRFCATGDLGQDLPGAPDLVQRRLVRAVHRAVLPSGPVFVKTMCFPRAKDRLRYALRPLPAAHEAAMLRRTAAAGIPCPTVLAVGTRRRRGLPERSMLVLRGLAVEPAAPAGAGRVAQQAGLTMRLLAAGIHHRDLHDENFVALVGGGLAVLDLQSATWRPSDRRCSGAVRLACAARLLRDRSIEACAAALPALREAGLVTSVAEAERLRLRAAIDRRRFERSRVRRCLVSGTDYARTFHWWGVEHRLRGLDVPARRRPHRLARAAWLGQQLLWLHEGRPRSFLAMARNWWWLGGRAALYIPATVQDQEFESQVMTLAAAYRRWSPSAPSLSAASETVCSGDGIRADRAGVSREHP